VFLVVWGFAIMVFPLQPGCAIVMSPFNSASLMCVVCLGVSVLPVNPPNLNPTTGLYNTSDLLEL
jgi:hypothetical protein